MSATTEEVRPRCLNIGVVAYELLPNDLVFVRVPNEPGRWVLTHHCVARVKCPVCEAIPGEPCYPAGGRAEWGKSRRRYWAGTHARRRELADRRRAFRAEAEVLNPKIRIRPEDIEIAYSDCEPSSTTSTAGQP